MELPCCRHMGETAGRLRLDPGGLMLAWVPGPVAVQSEVVWSWVQTGKPWQRAGAVWRHLCELAESLVA